MDISHAAPSPIERRHRVERVHAMFYALIVAGCVLRIVTAVNQNPMQHLWSDPLRHWDHASEPLMPSPMALFDPPVYQMWLSLVQRVTMGIPGLVAVYAAALSVVTPWCWYRFFREALASRTLALAGWAVLALLPSWISIYSYFMTETLFLPALGASLWLSARARRKATLASFLTMVAMWTACGLTRPIAIPAAAAAAAWVWFRHPAKLRTAAWSVLILVVTLTPFSWRNHHFYGIWAPHGNGWINKIYTVSGAREIRLHFVHNGARWEYGFGSPSIDSRPFAPLSNWTSSRTGAVDVSIDFAYGERDWKRTYRSLPPPPIGRARLHVENLAFLFFGDSWPDNNAAYFVGRMANLSRWLWAPLGLLLIGASICFWRQVVERPLLPLTIAVWLFFQGWLLVVPSEGRYRKPMEGLFVAYALVLTDSRRRSTFSKTTSSSDGSASTATDAVRTQP